MEITVSSYALLDDEPYAMSVLYEPDVEGEELPGHEGRWRRVASVGEIPGGAQPITSRDYATIIAQRRAEQDTALQEAVHAEQQAQRQARSHLLSLGLSPESVEAIVGGGAT